ncbi:2,3-diketo-L-gulonate-binding periplasmic protein YiaO [Rhodobacteraceae bacterium IMCC1933]|nr:2,3-diketo-L-gulonate-binding periplasmic protein YiaO [Rhodobacteraceae bacterium IMCC1923]MDP4068283.1 2,3-diketo-L-gulonate-binding periplasmic protein YiaO [Rhodobacteraceae bacterium IMCC1933]MDP4071549.1 2,3-diketo-L-gulonate-binding periplasmic protein YiaO [Rhodobacteraceae bacterium IMCC1909]
MIELKFGGYQGDKSVHTRGGRVLAEAVAEETDGAVTIAFDESIVARGHKAADLLSMTESGELDGCYFSSSYLAKRVPELGLFDQHFVVPDRRRAYALLDGALGNRLRDEVAKATGFEVLGYWDNGLRHITSAVPIKSVADCTGLKLRTLANEDHQRVFRALGFDPHAIDVRDLPEAVTTRRVDAQENPLTNTLNFGIHETHRHILLTRHLLGVALVLFNAKRLAELEPAHRAGLQRAVDRATQAQRRFAEDDDDICSAELRAQGVELTELDDATRTAFAQATRPEVDMTRASFSPELRALFDEELSAA